MFSVPTEVPTAERARWLAELADVLDQAHRLLFELDVAEDVAADTLDLHGRIEAAKLEVQSLRLSRSIAPRKELGPDWTNFIAWPAARAGS